MFSLFLALALAAEPSTQVAPLFPGAKRIEVAGKPALGPIRRKGLAGFVPIESISAIPVIDGRTLLSFQLQLADIDPTVEAIGAAASGAQSKWNRVLAVVLLGADGSFIAKPEGFPREQSVDLECRGDFCDLGPRGKIRPVEGSTRFGILEIDPQPESLGSFIPIEVLADSLVLYKERPQGTSGGLTGCSRTVQWQSFKESKGALKALRMRVCGEENPRECAEQCEEAGYPIEKTLTPVTLSN